MLQHHTSYKFEFTLYAQVGAWNANLNFKFRFAILLTVLGLCFVIESNSITQVTFFYFATYILIILFVASGDQVNVEATVVEKTLSHNKIWCTYKKRKRFRRLKSKFIPLHTCLEGIQMQIIMCQRF